MKLGKITLTPEQAATVKFLNSGNILVAGVGSGKTFTSIFWAAQQKKDIVVITTAAKRDKIDPGHSKPDWHESLELCGINDYTVDSWNNVDKYTHLKQCVFIFDEAKGNGSGKWAKSFVTIAKNNDWILATATPSDNWLGYIPVFLASGFYKNRSDFANQHIIYDRYAKFPKINAIVNQQKLEKLRRSITVTMVVPRDTYRHIEYINCDFDLVLNKDINTRRWDPYNDEPIETPARLAQVLRQVVASDPDRIAKAEEIMRKTNRIIVFYNYNFELEILRELCEKIGKPYGEYNGHNHDAIPTAKDWIYLVHYSSSEGWNCTVTDTILFYSPNYSWWQFEQAQGRIDRMNTPYTDLYYYLLVSDAKIDKDVITALENKESFNENTWGKQEMRVS